MKTTPAWSPDGTQIAFIQKHGEGDVDKMPNRDVFVIDAKAGAQARRLTTTTAEENGRLAWSPDGKNIAYFLGDEVKFSAYDQLKLAVVPPRAVALASSPNPSTVRSIRSTGRRTVPPCISSWSTIAPSTLPRCRPRVERVERVIEGRQVVSNPGLGADGHLTVLASTATEIPGSPCARRRQAAAPDEAERRLAEGRPARNDRGLHVHQQGRHGGQQHRGQTGRLRRLP